MLSSARLERAATPAPPRASADRPDRAAPRDADGRALGRLLAFSLPRAHGPQAKLAVGARDDAYEREADRVADAVTRDPAPRLAAPSPAPRAVQRRCAGCAAGSAPCAECKARAEEEEAGVVRRKEAGPGAAPAERPLAAQVDAATAGGDPLPAPVRGYFEPRLGRGLDHVRVHTGARADEAARAVNARAFTLGRDVVFAAGEYRPESATGRHLLAHELAHVVQQGSAGVLRRAPGDDDAKAKKASAAAAKFSHLEVRPSVKPDPCACLVFMHNEERNARKTAELMHANCAYNLAIVSPDRPGDREIVIGKGPATIDPNELFPPSVAEACRKDPAACADDVKKNAGAPTLASTQKQFFLAIDQCSNGFTLPVVALHNNSIDDTTQLRARKDKIKDPFDGVPTDIDKTAKPADGTKPADPVKALKAALKKQKFDTGPLIDTKGKTNIFRWCAAGDISRCHIGDPHHPDNVVWVTNQKDFDRMKTQPINVAMQGAAAKGGESETDLSTLFLTVAGLIGGEAWDRVGAIWHDLDVGEAGLSGSWEALGKMWDELAAGSEAMGKVRYINIETPATRPDKSITPEQHRVDQYRAVVATLKAAGLHCCGDDTAAAEKAIEDELGKAPAKAAKKKAPAK